MKVHSAGLLFNELGLVDKRFKFPIYGESQINESGFQFRTQVKRSGGHAQRFEYVLPAVFLQCLTRYFFDNEAESIRAISIYEVGTRFKFEGKRREVALHIYISTQEGSSFSEYGVVYAVVIS